jgi:hypothetical protein
MEVNSKLTVRLVFVTSPFLTIINHLQITILINGIQYSCFFLSDLPGNAIIDVLYYFFQLMNLMDRKLKRRNRHEGEAACSNIICGWPRWFCSWFKNRS